MDIKEKVASLAKKYRTRDPFEMVEQLNAIVVYHPLNGVRGFYQYFKRNNIIYIDERLSHHDQAFVLSHELGHMFLHRKANAIFMDTRTNFVTSKYEIEANRFAMNLLITDSDIEEHIDFTLSQLSRLFGYSKNLIELRLKDFN